MYRPLYLQLVTWNRRLPSPQLIVPPCFWDLEVINHVILFPLWVNWNHLQSKWAVFSPSHSGSCHAEGASHLLLWCGWLGSLHSPAHTLHILNSKHQLWLLNIALFKNQWLTFKTSEVSCKNMHWFEKQESSLVTWDFCVATITWRWAAAVPLDMACTPLLCQSPC